MKAREIIGYEFDGEFYCVDCTIPQHPCDCPTDENGICKKNCHGYGPTPIFAEEFEGPEACNACGCEVHFSYLN